MTGNRYKPMWQTNVGSHLWGMEHEGSDIDVYEAVQVPTRDILLGHEQTRFPNRTETRDRSEFKYDTGSSGIPDNLKHVKYDFQTHEIGTIVQQVLKGNVNHLWGVFSPIQFLGSIQFLYDFQNAAHRNLSAECYDSIRGLATSNVKKYIETGKDVSKKRLNIIARTVQFGITLLDEGRVNFARTDIETSEELYAIITRLDEARENSPLPDEPKEPQALEQLLLQVRERDLGL